MSTSTTAAMDSRSSSPATPDSSDGIHPITIHRDHEFNPWYHSGHSGRNISELNTWDDATHCVAPAKPEEERMLELDDLIDEHAYDEYGRESFLPNKFLTHDHR